MTDVARLCKSGSIVVNGGAVITSMQNGNHGLVVPYLNKNILPISGVNGVTNNGYLDNRFRAT